MLRQESDLPHTHSSLMSLQSTYAQLAGASCHRSHLADSILADKRFGDRVPLSSSVIKIMFFLVSCTSFYQVLNTAVGILRRNIHRVPFLMYLKFIRVLVKKGKDSVSDSMAGMTYSSSSEYEPMSSHSSDVCNAVREISVYDEVTTRLTIVTPDEDDHDDYGFFADFEDEDNSLGGEFLEDPFQSLVRSKDSCMSSLCTLEEGEEEG